MALMTIAQYARHRGVQDRAVVVALKNGRIHRRDVDGLIDSESADREWEAKTNHRMSAAGKINGALGQAMVRRRKEQAAQQGMPQGDTPVSAAQSAALGIPKGGSNPVPLPGTPDEGKVPPAPLAVPKDPSDMEAFSKARAIREKYAAMLSKLDYEERSGKLIDAFEVKTAAEQLHRILRDLLMAIPDRISAELAAEENAANCHRLLEGEIRTVLEKVATLRSVGPRRSTPYVNAG
jgi:hypothetical protein